MFWVTIPPGSNTRVSVSVFPNPFTPAAKYNCRAFVPEGSPVSHSLSRWQAVVLGLVVVLAVGLAGVGLTQIAARQGLWADTFEVAVGFPEVHDVGPGTPVRVRGVDAGQVVAVEYPDHDGPDAAVTVRMKLDARYAGRLYADASAQVHANGLLGSKVVAISPGRPTAGPLADGRLRAAEAPDLAKAAARLEAVAGKIGDAADEAKQLVHDARNGKGTLGKLIKDDELYTDLKGLAADSREAVQDARQMVRQANSAIGRVEGEVDNVQRFVADGRDTLRSVKQGTDAMQRLPIVRGYVEDAAAILVRPTCRREAATYSAAHLFDPGTAILSDEGRAHLMYVVEWLKGVQDDRAEVVAVAQCDPNDRSQTSASATELTKKQAEAVVEFLKAHGVHRIGWGSRIGIASGRKMTPVGLGFGPSPVVERDPLPPSHVQVLLFTPQ
jgi:phospholipid/cholesterol/gamma-HCH transport system substrate-binding protein